MQSSRLHVPSLLQLLFSSMGLITLAPAAVGILLIGVISLLEGNGGLSQAEVFFSFAWSVGFISILVIPSVAYALRRLLSIHWPPKAVRPVGRLPGVLMAFWPFLLFLGEYFQQKTSVSWLFVPPLQILSVVIPIWWMLEIGRRGINWGTPQQLWGLASFGTLATPVIIILAEFLVIVIVVAAWAVYLGTHPAAVKLIRGLAQEISSSQGSPEAVLLIIRPYLQRPAVIATVAGVISGIVPVIEELLKSLGLWYFVRRKLSPAEGFSAGLLCGAVFAVMESLISLAAPLGNAWIFMVAARAGTALLHISTTGLMGWGLASAWTEGRHLRLLGAFITAVLVHGFWNIFGILLGAGDLVHFTGQSLLGRLTIISPFALLILVAALLIFLVRSNRYLRRVTSPWKSSTGIQAGW